MSHTPTVSIIVPVYNIENYVSECIDSVISQTFRDFELILVDDGSTDESGSICDWYAKNDKRIKVIHKANGGLASARNAGLESSSGDWIMHIDGDDWIDTDMLMDLLDQAIIHGEKVDIVDAGFRKVWDNGHSVDVLNFYDSRDKKSLLTSYIGHAWTSIWGGIVKRRLYEQFNLRSPEGITFCEDFHLAVRLRYYANEVIKINKSYYNYRQRNSSLLHSNSSIQAHDEQWVIQDIIQFFKEQGDYETYREPLNWHLLKSSQELLLDPSSHEQFLLLCGEITDREILSCDLVNNKIKCLSLFMKHRLSFAVRAILKLREAYHNLRTNNI